MSLLRPMGVGAERPGERPRNWGETTAFGADVGRIDPARIDSGADRPVPMWNAES